MVSLRNYTKEFILTEVKHRFEKIASLLDDTDYEDQFARALAWVDQALYCPRVVLFQETDFTPYKGTNFIDVTNLHIDVINNVYYEDKNSTVFNTILPELGLLPFITNGSSLSQLGDVTNYLMLKSNINMMNRQLDLTCDYELFPVDENGLQMLQLRNQGKTKVEFLPNLSIEFGEWTLYDFEYRALKDLTYCFCNLFNAEMQLSAQSLGVGKEASTLTSYWEKKIEETKKEFLDSVMITWMA